MVADPDLVERAGELAAIHAAVRVGPGDPGRVVLVQGPAGIGKTSLLQAGTASAAGNRVLTARGGTLETDLAFGVVAQGSPSAANGRAPPPRCS